MATTTPAVQVVGSDIGPLPRNSLRRLIHDRIVQISEELDLRDETTGARRLITYKELAARAGTTIGENGQKRNRISKTTFHNYATVPLMDRLPPPLTMKALADALGVPHEQVVVVAAAEFGLFVRPVTENGARLVLLGERTAEQVGALAEAADKIVRGQD